jgi:mxaJ protein
VSARWLVIAGVAAFAPPAAHAVEPLRVCADPNDLPFSNAAGEGFENKIAEMIADELGRPLEYVWRAERRGFLREGLNSSLCDLVTAVPLGMQMVRTTRPYYRSTYVFVSRPGDPAVSSFDDPSLKVRKVGVQMIGDDGMNSPPAHALAERGVIDTVRGFPVYGDYRKDDPAADIVRAVADHEIDVAAVWGPVAGYFAERQSPPLVVTPLTDQGTARIPMVFDIAMGVRKRDDDLKQAVQAALDALEPRIDETLRQYGVTIVTSEGTQ